MFFQKFWSKIFTMWPFWSKTVESRRKIFNGKFFTKSTFRFRIRFKTFWIESEKFFFSKFWWKIFTMWPFWSKNGRVPEKNFQREIFFEIDFFGLEYVLKYSESILKKKIFFSKSLVENFYFWSFLTIFWLFLAIFEIFNFENEKSFLTFF